jgi:hypothetical protein
MAKPTANTELGGAKIVLLADSTGTTPAARCPAAVQSSASGDAAYTIGWQGVATHRAGDALTTPGGFSVGGGGVGTASAPVALIAGKAGSTVTIPEIATTTPGATDPALVVRLASSGGTAIGAVTISAGAASIGTVVLGAGAATVGAVTQGAGAAVAGWRVLIHDGTNAAAIKAASTAALATDPSLVVALSPNSAIPAGTATIGSVKQGGWDHAALAPQRGLQIGISDTNENTLLAAVTPLNNVVDVAVGYFSGTAAAPTTPTYLSFRHGVAGTEFLRVYLPVALSTNFSDKYTFTIPSRGATLQAVTVKINQAGGTGYQYSAVVHAYTTAT